jgi:hypothetical protein
MLSSNVHVNLISCFQCEVEVKSFIMTNSLDGEIFFVAMCRFPEIESVYLNMPNIHFLPVNMPTVGVKVKLNFYHSDLSCIS